MPRPPDRWKPGREQKEIGLRTAGNEHHQSKHCIDGASVNSGKAVGAGCTNKMKLVEDEKARLIKEFRCSAEQCEASFRRHYRQAGPVADIIEFDVLDARSLQMPYIA